MRPRKYRGGRGNDRGWVRNGRCSGIKTRVCHDHEVVVGEEWRMKGGEDLRAVIGAYACARNLFVYLFIHLFLGERSQWKLIREGEEYEFRPDRVFILR